MISDETIPICLLKLLKNYGLKRITFLIWREKLQSKEEQARRERCRISTWQLKTLEEQMYIKNKRVKM